MPSERTQPRHERTGSERLTARKKPASVKNDASMSETTEPTFEESLAELQRIVGELEQGDLGLSDSLVRYEEGIRRLKQCYQQLEAAERRMERLRSVDADGTAVTEPFNEAEMTLEEKAAARGARRTFLAD